MKRVKSNPWVAWLLLAFNWLPRRHFKATMMQTNKLGAFAFQSACFVPSEKRAEKALKWVASFVHTSDVQGVCEYHGLVYAEPRLRALLNRGREWWAWRPGAAS